ncbi:LOW QUALITY PROTEIN: uncharacterized protein C3orf84 homolog [Suncus etruscus]|uniref:LOW QUALITY PROTEIN: uncharacterized protein C3orf84 homolog n=1 Tax=Suncus etruscus TaxID=109475 RepID=UPI00210F5D58|nr:LOW QUALITY PROTEIN: uncharacterized protein C3orf84 homolog [Suncus etruscus]
MKSYIVGSWYNSGFYGHYRGQFRSDGAQEYRLAAKPQPPDLFLQRCQEPVRQHYFSKHDNRTSYDKGPYWMLQGIGRRKDLQQLWQQHNFLRWAPCELELSQQRPHVSSYQTSFQKKTGFSDFPQRLVHFIQLQTPSIYTTYQQNFCHPFRDGHYGINEVQPKTLDPTTPLSNLPDIPRRKQLQHYFHNGVSECLNWSIKE